MRPYAFLLCLCLVLLSGCLPKTKEWTHAREPNPRKEDLLFETDSKFCEDKIGPSAQGQSRDAAMADCLTRLGWKRRD